MGAFRSCDQAFKEFDSSLPSRRSVALDCPIAGLATYHLPHLITDLLPVANEVAGLFPAHHFCAQCFQNRNNGFCIGALLVTLFAGNRSE
jgi:hypothetical protein